jgi:uncharacterized protein (DUF58 family)
MWTRKGWTLFFLAVLSLFIGLYIGDFQFGLFGLVIFIFISLTLLISRPVVVCERELSSTNIFEQNKINVSVSTKRKGSGAGIIELFDPIPDYSILTEGSNKMIYNISNPEKLDYQLEFPLRGFYGIGPTKVRARDYFSLFYEEKDVVNKEQLTVFPYVGSLKKVKIKANRYKHYPGDFLTPQPGASTEFYSIRDYQKGDPFKKINWKVSVKRRELMVNEYEKENICDVFIILDARAVNAIGTPQDNALEFNIKVALNISEYLINNRNQIGVAVYGDRVDVLRPGSGRNHFIKILRMLTGTYPTGFLPLNIAMYYTKTFIKSKTAILLFTNLEYDHSLLDTVKQLYGYDYRIIVITPSSIEYENRLLRGQYIHKLALMRIERENYINKLRNCGATVLECALEDDIETVVNNLGLMLS